MLYRPGLFSIDGLAGTFAGYTTGDRWNGWATPVFAESEARRIAASFAAQEPVSADLPPYSAEVSNGTFVFQDPESDEPDIYPPQEIDVDEARIKVYPIGTYYWTWEEE